MKSKSFCQVAKAKKEYKKEQRRTRHSIPFLITDIYN